MRMASFGSGIIFCPKKGPVRPDEAFPFLSREATVTS